MNLENILKRYSMEIAIMVGAISLVVTPYVLRKQGYEPEYLRKTSSSIKNLCANEAKHGRHNIAILGGSDAEYFVALEDCVRNQEKLALDHPGSGVNNARPLTHKL